MDGQNLEEVVHEYIYIYICILIDMYILNKVIYSKKIV